MRVAIYLAHAYLPPAVRQRCLDALAPHTVTLVPVVAGEGYPAYEALASRLRPAGSGSLWRGIRALLPEADCYVVAGFSAGGALVRLLAAGPDPERDRELGALVSLDGSYAKELPAGPAPEHVEPWVRAAERARFGGPVLVMGASEVDPVAYASTDEVLRAEARASQVVAHDVPEDPLVAHPCYREADGIGLLLRWYRGKDAAGHSAALVEWGPALVAEAVRRALARRAGASTEPPATEPAPPLEPVDTIPTGSSDPKGSELREGARGPLVADVQRAVGCRADGAWGPGTSRAVAAMQRSVGLPVRPAWGTPERAARADMPRGVDVSHHQGPVGWATVRSAGYGFAIIRAAYGATRDDRAAAHWATAGVAGMKRMGYLFLRPGLPVLAQTSAALATLPECRGWWLDVEQDGGAGHHTRAEVDAALRSLGATARVGVYTASWWWDACGLGACDAPLWLAGPGADRLPGAWDRWTCWQPAVRAVPGVVGECDVDVWARRDALGEWAV